jgi:ribosome-associated protein
MIQITPGFTLDETELQFEYLRAAGPGGQNVNKLSTAVQLRWDLGANQALPIQAKERLRKLAGRRMTAEDVLVIEARRYRTQEQNRQDALQRLVTLVRQALEPPKARKPTRPSAAARQKRLEDKKWRSEIKRLRRGRSDPSSEN